MKQLRIELREHKEIEKELGKRSHFCNRVIKKYKDQILLLKEEILQRKSSTEVASFNGDLNHNPLNKG